ncbi:MAG: phosphotransferase [Planctomycetia bacterium]|nr:phosphotransferase [Planctomycetia bacterium]
MTPLPEQPPVGVIAHFALHTRGLTWIRVSGGLSGARVWRGEVLGVPRVALKEWPENITRERLEHIHAWMSRAEHLRFVPHVFANTSGETVHAEGGRAWDACQWMMGEARQSPTTEEIASACDAVAHLHRAWATKTQHGPCPGVLNRLQILSAGERILRAGPEAIPSHSPQLDALVRRTVRAVARVSIRTQEALRVWENRSVALQPCVRDLRGEHILFEANRIVGIIDFGALAVDSPAVDLSRLLGDFAPDEKLFAAGLNQYRASGGALDVPDEFVSLLARSGITCSVIGWLIRLVVRRELISDPASVVARLSGLVAQVEQSSST